jgi:hypothetical protein
MKNLLVPTVASLAVVTLAVLTYAYLRPQRVESSQAVRQTAQPTAAYGAAKAKWLKAKLSDYRFTLMQSCECLPEAIEPTVIVVRGDKVAEAFYKRTGIAVDSVRQSRLPTINGLFQMIDDAYAKPAALVRFKANVDVGYLEEIFVDRDAAMVDEELIYLVTDFQIQGSGSEGLRAPNPSIERTLSGLRPPSASHVKR